VAPEDGDVSVLVSGLNVLSLETSNHPTALKAEEEEQQEDEQEPRAAGSVMFGGSALAVLLVVKLECDGCCLQQLCHGCRFGNNEVHCRLKLHILHPKFNGLGAHILGWHSVFANSLKKEEYATDIKSAIARTRAPLGA
jgi:hypothetical protein